LGAGKLKQSEIREISVLFRNALEKLPIEKFPESSFFNCFPRGCCGDSSHLLAKYFKDANLKPYYVCGWMGRQSHAWIELDGLIIDITADQFDEITEGVIVTNDSEFHKKFDIHDRYLSDFDTHDERSANRYKGIYDYILEYISESK
jgi:hypothetical protein